MQNIGNSSLWEYKYAPNSVEDLILPQRMITYLQTIVAEGECPNLLLYGSAGRGKTATAYALCYDLGANFLYINGSLETSIDTLRYKVLQFATSNSLDGGKKIVIMDETDRISANAADALKGILDQVQSKCRFIFTTNNFAKIIDPIVSRCSGGISYDFDASEAKHLKKAYFQRLCWILNNEKVPYTKPVLADFVKAMYPDMRRTLNKLQQCVRMYGNIDENIFTINDNAKLDMLIPDMKERKFSNVRKALEEIDAGVFFTSIYDQLVPMVQPESLPDIVMTIANYDYQCGFSINKTNCLTACCVALMKQAKWR